MLTNYRQRRGGMRVGTNIARMAYGATKALYKNRAAIKEAAKGLLYKKKGVLQKPARKIYSAQAGAPVNSYAGGNDYTRSRKVVGRKYKPTVSRLEKLVRAGMNTAIYRFQNITNYDTNAGAMRLSNCSLSHDSSVMSPVHVYDLTCFPNTNSTVAPGRALGWASTAAAADVKRLTLFSQTPTGASATTGAWFNEANGGISQPLGVANYCIMHHDWSDIRINFYGPRKRTTKFEVIFARVKDTLATPLNANVSNVAFKELLRYVERPMIYSNLQSYNANVAKKFKIVKRFTYFISAGQTTDTDTNVGKIKEARIFMRHGRIYNLDWRHEVGGTDLGHAQADGDDYIQDTNHHDFPWHGSRLFMFVRAFSPERRALTTANDNDYQYQGIDATLEPSYDIIIRNQISFPS